MPGMESLSRSALARLAKTFVEKPRDGKLFIIHLPSSHFQPFSLYELCRSLRLTAM